MSDADMSMARDNVPGGFNLAVGEPFFLQEIYKFYYPEWFRGSLTYPPVAGEPKLLEQLQKRHPGKHIVITNGAKQALLAAGHALHNVERKSMMAHEAPYWPTYPTIAKLSGMEFQPMQSQIGSSAYVARVLTAPNNPDGSMKYWNRKWDIWDAAYASPVYGWDGHEPQCRISVWSAAKQFGVSSYRIGWLVTESEHLAKSAATYVEQTTSGVSMPSQHFLFQLLSNLETMSEVEQAKRIQMGRDALLDTATELSAIDGYFVNGFKYTGKGMFAWVEAFDPEHFRDVLQRAKVKVVGGEHCGATNSWFRISLGVTPETMRAAVQAISKAEEDGSPQ